MKLLQKVRHHVFKHSVGLPTVSPTYVAVLSYTELPVMFTTVESLSIISRIRKCKSPFLTEVLAHF